MIRVQIQLPKPLAEQLKGIAGMRDISFAELCRRGLERYADQWAWTSDAPAEPEPWKFPTLPPNEMNEGPALDRQEALAVENRTA